MSSTLLPPWACSRGTILFHINGVVSGRGIEFPSNLSVPSESPTSLRNYNSSSTIIYSVPLDSTASCSVKVTAIGYFWLPITLCVLVSPYERLMIISRMPTGNLVIRTTHWGLTERTMDIDYWFGICLKIVRTDNDITTLDLPLMN